MTIISIYDIATGRIIRTLNCSNELDLTNNIVEGETYIIGDYNNLYYIENNTPILKSEKPGNDYFFNYTSKSWIINIESVKNTIKNRRNILLLNSDWTQLPNSPLTLQQQQAWTTYRQALRDIPGQTGYPLNVVWPTLP
ncbi:Phage tail assembly chaperone protein [uncultured Caudovirales phage]|uniref:Phage tail assembly chaperone protein n=1 Tax=uncultured Caudovirales phage TaxID=2100421 RepID=A0A6J5SM55_9CAUD|nr:Phage tail assembly chaperone protein [uncultured Caudovirales phage]CAB4185367.1 Phage tail assembly chaperone protein [uncultured Caudovirales phage]CAB4193491.1 Phage tail assembly chaperone protein [uncultured Caudovirales phage]CAB4216031.1 Phage tail assembly chaperone protein [uncultured Caudovirales phage]CAB5230711.1 Phage tail assembly chaperone protein [uncultured Caudovirales phage]